jgi:hypothetical protein
MDSEADIALANERLGPGPTRVVFHVQHGQRIHPLRFAALMLVRLAGMFLLPVGGLWGAGFTFGAVAAVPGLFAGFLAVYLVLPNPQRIELVYRGDVRDVTWNGQHVSLVEEAPREAPLALVYELLAAAAPSADAKPSASREAVALARFVHGDDVVPPNGGLSLPEDTRSGGLDVATGRAGQLAQAQQRRQDVP